MEASLALIEICKIGMIVSIIVCIAGLALAVLMYFKYDIKTIRAIRSGKAEAMSVQKMQEQNLQTGQLRKQVDLDFTTDNLKNGKKSKNKSGRLNTAEKTELPGCETTPLASEMVSTPEETVTGNTYSQQPEESMSLPIKFVIIEENVIIHTDEIV